MDESSSGLSASEAKQRLEEMFKGIKSDSGLSDTGIRNTRRPTGRVRSFSKPKRSNGRAPTEYRMRLERLRNARGQDEIVAAADTYLKHHQLPDEPSVLYKVLCHPNEKVCRDALGQLSALLMQGRLESLSLLGEHLKDLRKRCQEPSTLSFVNGISDQIAAAQ